MLRLVLLHIALVVTSLSAPPDLSGTWSIDGFMGPAPIGFPGPNAICSAKAGTPDGAGNEQLTPVGTVTADLVITQDAKTISIDRRYGGSLGTGNWKTVVNLDGSESTTVNGAATVAVRGKWEGETLVLDHHLTQKDATCSAKETLSIARDGTLSVVATNEGRASRQTYVKKTSFARSREAGYFFTGPIVSSNHCVA